MRTSPITSILPAFAGPKPVRVLLFSAHQTASLEHWRWERLIEKSSVHGLVWQIVDALPEPLNTLEAFGWQHSAWVEDAIEQAQALHAKAGFDLVVSSGPPLQAHLAARGFARLLGVPWLLDSVRPMQPGDVSSMVSKMIAVRLERGLILEADHLMASSQGLLDRAQSWREQRANAQQSKSQQVSARSSGMTKAMLSDPMLFSPMGHDDLPVRSWSKTSAWSRPIRLVCTQMVNPADVACLLEALGQRQEFLQRFEVILAGAQPELARLAKRFGSAHQVHFLGGVSAAAQEVLEREADVILSFGQASTPEPPLGLSASVMRSRPLLHVLGHLHDPGLQLLAQTPAYLSCDNNRFSLTGALEAILRGAWVQPEAQLPEDWSWLALGSSLSHFIKDCCGRVGDQLDLREEQPWSHADGRLVS